MLPLDDRVHDRFLVRPPNPVTQRSRYVYYDGVYIPTQAMPNIKNLSHSITATVDLTAATLDGIIVSCGDRNIGYAFYAKDGGLHFHYNAAGDRSEIHAPRCLTTQSTQLRYEFEKTGTLHGNVSLVVDGHLVASGTIGPTVAYSFAPLGLTIGFSRSSSITADYDPPYRFGGRIDHVVFDIETEKTPDGPPIIND